MSFDGDRPWPPAISKASNVKMKMDIEIINENGFESIDRVINGNMMPLSPLECNFLNKKETISSNRSCSS